MLKLRQSPRLKPRHRASQASVKPISAAVRRGRSPHAMSAATTLAVTSRAAITAPGLSQKLNKKPSKKASNPPLLRVLPVTITATSAAAPAALAIVVVIPSKTMPPKSRPTKRLVKRASRIVLAKIALAKTALKRATTAKAQRRKNHVARLAKTANPMKLPNSQKPSRMTASRSVRVTTRVTVHVPRRSTHRQKPSS